MLKHESKHVSRFSRSFTDGYSNPEIWLSQNFLIKKGRSLEVKLQETSHIFSFNSIFQDNMKQKSI